jgi:hypothetical protein
LSSCTPVSLPVLKCICALTLSCRFTYCSFASIGHADIICSIVSSSCWHSLYLLSVSVFSIWWRSTSCLMIGLVLPLFILHGLLSHPVADTVCIYCPSLCLVFGGLLLRV